MRDKEDYHIYQVDKYRALANFVMSMLPLSSILLIIFLEINRGEKMTVSTTFTIVSIIASMNKPLVRFVEVLDKYYMYKNSKKAVNRLLFYIPDKPGFNIHSNKSVKTGEIRLIGSDIMIEDQKAMNIALSKIFGDQFDLMEEMRNANFAIRAQKMKEYSDAQVAKGRDGGDIILGKREEDGEFIMGSRKEILEGKRKRTYQKISNSMKIFDI